METLWVLLRRLDAVVRVRGVAVLSSLKTSRLLLPCLSDGSGEGEHKSLAAATACGPGAISAPSGVPCCQRKHRRNFRDRFRVFQASAGTTNHLTIAGRYVEDSLKVAAGSGSASGSAS